MSQQKSLFNSERGKKNDVLVTSPCLNINDPTSAWASLEHSQVFQTVPTIDSSNFSQSKQDARTKTRIACISDTHGKHRNVFVPKCDLLIHCGDFSKSGEMSTIRGLTEYFKGLKASSQAKQIICIAGNHDLSFQSETYRQNWNKLYRESDSRPSQLDEIERAKNALKESCIYLEDEVFCHDDITFYGSPWTPTYHHCWAFMKSRSEIHQIWDQIPTSTDVLITHGPPLGRGDKCLRNNVRAGCLDLLRQVQTRIRPRLHLFGHIHEGAGCSFDDTTLYVNASSCSVRYKVEQPCIVIDLPHDKAQSARLVKPKCQLSGEEIVSWLKKKKYHKIAPYFEKMNPMLGGNDLINEHVDVVDLENSLKFGVKRTEERSELRIALMELQSESYDLSSD